MTVQEESRMMRSLYRKVFSDPDGRRVLMHICKKANVHRGLFSENPSRMAYNEGMRHLALSIARFATQSDMEVVELTQQLDKPNES